MGSAVAFVRNILKSYSRQEHTNYQLSFTDILCFFYFQKFVLKEGCKFKIRIEFYVQRDIITGLKYVQKTYMKGIPG